MRDVEYRLIDSRVFYVEVIGILQSSDKNATNKFESQYTVHRIHITNRQRDISSDHWAIGQWFHFIK